MQTTRSFMAKAIARFTSSSIRKSRTSDSVLFKSLYGLKQASRIWFLALYDTIHDLGFASSELDPWIFISIERNIILAISVDDILVMGPQTRCDDFATSSNSDFELPTRATYLPSLESTLSADMERFFFFKSAISIEWRSVSSWTTSICQSRRPWTINCPCRKQIFIRKEVTVPFIES